MEKTIYRLRYSWQSGGTEFDRTFGEFESQFLDDVKQIAKINSHRKGFLYFITKETTTTEKKALDLC